MSDCINRCIHDLKEVNIFDYERHDRKRIKEALADLAETRGCNCTESLAKFAFSILWQAAEFSLEHGVVIFKAFFVGFPMEMNK